MAELTYDPALPFAVTDGEKVFARFLSKDCGQYYADEEGLELVDTTPVPLPQGTGAVVSILGLMPLIRVAEECWIMPAALLPERHRAGLGVGGVQPLAEPNGYGVFRLTDNEVRQLIAKKRVGFTGIDGP